MSEFECENDGHLPVEAVACIHLVDLDDDPTYEGYKVCPDCLGEFITEVCLAPRHSLRRAFALHPTIGPSCP